MNGYRILYALCESECADETLTTYIQNLNWSQLTDLDTQFLSDMLILSKEKTRKLTRHFLTQYAPELLSEIEKRHQVSSYQEEAPRRDISLPTEYTQREKEEMKKTLSELHADHVGFLRVRIPRVARNENLGHTVEQLLTSLSLQELYFLDLCTRKSDSLLEKGKKQGIINFLKGKAFVLEVNKIDSKLFIVKTLDGNITFVNDIPKESAKIWEAAHELGLPVAPILQTPTENESGARVYSRYCGMSIAEIGKTFRYQDENKNYEIFHEYLWS